MENNIKAMLFQTTNQLGIDPQPLKNLEILQIH